MQQQPFEIRRPAQQTSPLVFSSPHSGREYSDAFVSTAILEKTALRSSEDAYVDHLIAPAEDFGIAMILARTPRAYVDFNRAPDELDPALIEGITRAPHNPRISSGLGVIPRVVSNGRSIYRGKLPLSVAEARIAGHWTPFHRALRGLLEETHGRFGQSVLLDWHSMPHEAVEHHGRGALARPEVVLGDRFGASAGQDWTDRIEAAFQEAGFRVARNSPFAGAFIAQSYGRPASGRHVIQIEIDRSIYMDERRVEPNDRYAWFRATLTGIIARIAGAEDRPALPLAAE